MSDEDERIPATRIGSVPPIAPVSSRPRSRAPILVLGALVSGCCVLGGVAILAEDRVATSIARDRLRERGIECDERFAVDVATTLGEATIGRTTCTIADGPVASFELAEPVTIVLDGTEATSVRAGRVRITTRVAPPVVRGTEWGAVLDALAVPQRVGMLVQGVAQLAARDLPEIDATSIEIAHDGEVAVALATVHLGSRGPDGVAPMGVRVERVELPAIAGPLGARATVGIAPLTGTATESHVELDGTISVDASLPLIGAMQDQRRLGIVADGVDTATPRYQIRL